jgi:hypothetical protein|tara:strand:+ start:2010 stop:2201 length:192 start_codon:yes stop_codon:yes gene_type:complete
VDELVEEAEGMSAEGMSAAERMLHHSAEARRAAHEVPASAEVVEVSLDDFDEALGAQGNDFLW